MMYKIQVDYSRRDGVPLFKKYALFNSGMNPLGQYERDIALLDDMKADSLRIDVFIGQASFEFGNTVAGEPGALQYDFTKLDTLAKLLNEHHVLPYYSWCYIPKPLQIDGDWRKGPSDLEAWEEIYEEYARHYRQSDTRVGYHEVYNEPDCFDVFFLGDNEDYIELYRRGAAALLRGDCDAVIGGPSSAFVDIAGIENIERFLKVVEEENLPLDFFSHHSYGYVKNNYINRIELSAQALSKHPKLNHTEQHLNELNSLLQPFDQGGPVEYLEGATRMLTSFERILPHTDVTLAHWAQYQDSSGETLGMISRNGEPRSTYRAMKMYASMPVARFYTEGNDDNVHILASKDMHGAFALVWNDSGEEQKIDILLKQLPFQCVDIKCTYLDDENDPFHNATANKDMCVQMEGVLIEEGQFFYQRSLAGHSILFLQLLDTEAIVSDIGALVGKFVRKHYWFEDRRKTCYSWFDEWSRTAVVGMGGESEGHSLVGATIDNLPEIIGIETVFSGDYDKSNSSITAIRIDYAVKDEYVKSVCLLPEWNAAYKGETFPFGTGRLPEEAIATMDFEKGAMQFNLKKYAPQDWDGRALFSFEARNIGKNAEIMVRLKCEE